MQIFYPHNGAGAASAGLFRSDAISPSVKKQTINNTESGVQGTLPGNYCAQIIAEIAIVGILQQSFTVKKRSGINIFPIYRCLGDTDSFCVSIHSYNYILA